MSPEIRHVNVPDVPDWLRAARTAFLQGPVVTDADIAYHSKVLDPERSLGAFDEGRCVATFRSFPQQLTVPGGAFVPADAVSLVTVAATHRRRGLLSAMMGRDLRAAKERGDTVATLISAEYPIYGRYGFGPATWVTQFEVDVPRTGLDRRYAGPGCGGRVDFADAAAVREQGPALYERVRPTRPGFVDRDERWWQRHLGELGLDLPRTEPYYVLYRSPEGRVDGLLAYTVKDRWPGKLPQGTAKVKNLVAATPQAERALWHFLLSVDWVLTVDTGFRAPDDLLPLLLPEPRAARPVAHADHLWVRPLDVPALLSARTYGTAGTLVLDVTDPAGYADGRFLLEAGPDGASCTPTTRPADLALDVGELGTLALGDESVTRLVALGRAREERTGAAALADIMLRTARRPWCPHSF
ncbi:GNAT family N-acetyltransferase [Streptomyces gamaensis]|uniref:GNAT family N-acetyltransferase n=1 Tax=Streptomyces gamaensis TaxID=1763542 RepID=A0ABW0Z486_9ACTN